MPSPVQEVRTVRLVFLGAARVGKTALIRRFLHDHFEPRHTRTVEEFHLLEYETEGTRVRVEILDTSGSYSFPAMRALNIRSGDAFALVFSAAEPDTFAEAQRLREEILELRGERRTPVTVVANKADLREVISSSAGAVAQTVVEQDWGAGFWEASARTRENVLGVFRDLLSRADVPSRGARRRDTLPRAHGGAQRKKPPFRKSNSCNIS